MIFQLPINVADPRFQLFVKKKALCLSWHLKWLKFRQMLSQPFKPYREVQMNSPGTMSNMSIIHYRAGWKSDWLSFSSVVLLLFRGGVCFVRQLLPQCQRKKMNHQRPDGDSISEKPRIWQRHLSYDRKYLARMFVTVIKKCIYSPEGWPRQREFPLHERKFEPLALNLKNTSRALLWSP